MKRQLLFVLFTCIFCLAAKAQFSDQLTIAQNIVSTNTIAPQKFVETSDGNYFYAHFSNTPEMGLYIVKVSSGGRILTGLSGKKIINATTSSGLFTNSVQMIADKNKGAYIVTPLNINGIADLYIFKIDENGNLLWQKKFDINYQLPANAFIANFVLNNILSDDAENLYVYYSKQDVLSQSSSKTIGRYCQKINKNGDFLWKKDNVITAPTLSANAFDNIGFLINFKQVKNNQLHNLVQINNGNLVIHRIDSTGVPIPTSTLIENKNVYAGNTISIDLPTENTFIKSIYNNTDVSYYTYLQRVDINGKYLFGTEGIFLYKRLSNQPSLFSSRSVVTIDDFIYSFNEYYISENNQPQKSQYFVQKYNQKGDKLWGEKGIQVNGYNNILGTTSFFPMAIAHDKKGIFLFWTENQNNQKQLFTEYIDVNGKLFYGNNGKRIISSATTNSINDFQFLKNKNNDLILNWSENNAKSYLQQIFAPSSLSNLTPENPKICLGNKVKIGFIKSGFPENSVFEISLTKDNITNILQTTTNDTLTLTIPEKFKVGTYRLVVMPKNQIDKSISTNLTIIETLTVPTLTTSKTSICMGDSLVIVSSGCNAKLLWSNKTETPILKTIVAQNTTYSAICTQQGCPNSAESNKIDIKALPLPSPTASSNSPIFQGEDLKLTATGGANYSWTGPNNFSSTVANPIISKAIINNAGIFTVSVMNLEGCTAKTNIEVKINPVLSIQNEAIEFTISPNPSSEIFTIHTNRPFHSLQAFDLGGKKQVLQKISEDTYSLKHLNAGKYFIQIMIYEKIFRKVIYKY